MNARSYILLSLTFLTFSSQGMAQPVLDQSQLIYNGGTSARTLPGYKIGQSFTAGKTGTLTGIDIGFFNPIDGDATLDIYSGAGAGGTLLQTQQVKVVCGGGACLLPFSTSVPLVSGQVYSFLLTPGAGIPDPYGIQVGFPATYSAGKMIFIDPSGTYFEDRFGMVFQTFVLAPCDPNSKEYIQLVLSPSNIMGIAGSKFALMVTSDKSISSKALDSISFDISYHGDLLESYTPYEMGNNITDIPGAIATASLTRGTTNMISVTVKGKDLSLDPSTAIARIEFEAMVADTTSTAITMSNLKLNGGDLDYKNCILSADPSNTNVTVQFLCGDSNLYKFIRTGRILDIAFIRPNPAKDDILLDLHSAQSQAVGIEITDELGALVFSEIRNISLGDNILHLDTHRLSSAVYQIKVKAPGKEVYQTLVIRR